MSDRLWLKDTGGGADRRAHEDHGPTAASSRDNPTRIPLWARSTTTVRGAEAEATLAESTSGRSRKPCGCSRACGCETDQPARRPRAVGVGPIGEPGAALDPTTRRVMEHRLGEDLSTVRIHDSHASAKAAEVLGANAYTVGEHVMFGRSRFQPATDGGRQLLAHELTHVVQQRRGEADGTRVWLRQPNSTTMSTAATVGPAAQRAYVEEVIAHLTGAASFAELARIDEARLERMLESWQTMVTEGDRFCTSLADVPLQARLHTAYTAAVRALMGRAATELHRPAVHLYLEKLHRIPRWAWPGAADFRLRDPAQKQAYIQATVNALNAVTFDPSTTAGAAQVSDTLARLRDMVSEQVQMIRTELGGDAGLDQSIRDAYRAAVRRILTAAAPNLGASVNELIVRYRYGAESAIGDFSDVAVAGVTAPLPMGSTAGAGGNVGLVVGGVQVTFLPDGTRQQSGAATDIHLTVPGGIQASTRNGVVVSHTGPARPQATIRTRYGPGLTAASGSGYGRGTTAADVAAGTTSLAFHEGSHARDYLTFLARNPFPAFTGSDGMSAQAFQVAMNAFTQAVQAYERALIRLSEVGTDCVGVTIEDYYHGLGRQSPTHCP
jgi:hypothetical protein